MYQKAPISDRVARIRKKYRTTKPKLDPNRYTLVTQYYMENPDQIGILKRAGNLKNLFENMPTPIHEDELIVGFPGETFRCSALFPDNHFQWIKAEIDTIDTRGTDPYDIDEDFRQYIKDTYDFWDKNCTSAKVDRYLPEGYKQHVGNGVLNWNWEQNSQSPIGHFCGNFWKVCDPGFGAIRDEAIAKMNELEENGIFGDSAKHYNFYRAIKMVSEGFITYTKRYAKEAARQAAECTDPVRKAELEEIAERAQRNPAAQHKLNGIRTAIERGIL